MKRNEKPSEKNATLAATESIAIIGMSCLFPKAQNLREYWSNIKGKVDAISEVPKTHWSPESYFDSDPKKPDFTYAKRGGFLTPIDFEPSEFGMSPATLEATDTSQLLGLVVAQGALIDAGYGPNRPFDRETVGVVLGLTGTLEMSIPLGARLGHPIWRKALKKAGIDNDIAEDIIANIGAGYVSWQENSFPGLLGNVVAGRIANRLDLGGTNCVCDAACASSFSATHLGVMELLSGRAKMIITGGVDTFNDIFMFMCFSKTPALSPSGNAQPFDVKADGTILGEGVGMVVLKRLSDAENDGDKIYAVIKSIGSSSDGKGKAIYAPSSQGQMKALRRAYQQAGITPESIELVEAHGTGTKVGDQVETDALTEVFLEATRSTPWCALGSVKSQIGHTKAAAGAAGLVKLALALKNKVLPPTIKVQEPNPAIVKDGTPFYINTEKRPWMPNSKHPRRGGVSAFGFGGSNFHIVVEEYQSKKTDIDWDDTIEIVALSASLKKELEVKLKPWHEAMSWAKVKRLAAESRQAFSSNHEVRLVFLIDKTKGDIPGQIAGIVANLGKNADRRSWSTPDGVYFGSGKPHGKLGVIFPGQGAQYLNMGLDLSCTFPEMFDTVIQADTLYGPTKDPTRRLADYLYPRAVFSDEARKSDEEKLRATFIAQPSIGAVSLGAYRILESFGVKPEAFAGHSFGELTALCAAGAITADDFFKLAKIRGELMTGDGKDRGSMIAVPASPEEIKPILEAEKLELVIANKNTPKQTVLSGATAEIKRAHEVFGTHKMRSTILPVSGAFHSSLVANAATPFRAALEKVEFKTDVAPVYSNTTGTAYPSQVKAIKDLLGKQLANPVEFVNEIKEMYRSGVKTFLEVGPGGKMIGLIKAILDKEECETVAIDASAGKKPGVLDLAKTLSHLAASGYALNLTSWEQGEAALKLPYEERKPKLTFPICGANYRFPHQEPPQRRKVGEAAQSVASVSSVSSVPSAAATVAASAGRSAATPQIQPQPQFHHQPQPTHHQPTTAPIAHAQAPVQYLPPMPAQGNFYNATADVFRVAQQSLNALQQLQQQTADLHRRFLEGQETAQKVIHAMIEQQTVISRGGMAQPMPQMQWQAPMQTSFVPQPMVAPAPVAAPPAFVHQSAPQAYVPASHAAPAPIHHAVAETAPAASSGLTKARVNEVVLAVVSEKTGYPSEMLNTDMDMESDLGIDSIKRVEIMSAVQEKLPEAPVMKPEQLGKIRTLKQVLEFLSEGASESSAAGATAPHGTPAHGEKAPAVSASSSASNVQPVLLAVVSEKTGYPVEMLNLDMNMESDLGIDSIKRVEIMSAIQEKMPEAPVIQPNQLGKLQTLRQIIDFLSEGAPQGSAAPAAPSTDSTVHVSVPPAAASASHTHIEATLLGIVSEKTGYPSEMLNLDMDMESDLGIDSIKRVEILSAFQEKVPDAPVVQPGDLGKFKTLQQVLTYLKSESKSAAPAAASKPAGATAASIAAHDEPTKNAPLHRTVLKSVAFSSDQPRQKILLPEIADIWITPDGYGIGKSLAAALSEKGYKPRLLSPGEIEDIEPSKNLAGVVIFAPPSQATGGKPSWPVSSEKALKQAFWLAQRAEKTLRANAVKSGAFFATVSLIDGAFGLNQKPIADPIQGGLAGLAKTASHEWPEVACKAIDLQPDWSDTKTMIRALAEEITQRGPLEIGLSASGAMIPTERKLTIDEESLHASLKKGDVVIVSGGARGVTAETAIALAKAHHPTLVLVGRSAEPSAEPEWLKKLEKDSEIKQALHANSKGNPLTPKKLEETYRNVMANREILRNLARIEAAGSKVAYRSIDVRDEKAVDELVSAIRSEFGPIRGIIHGAGVLRDRRIEDKTIDQFNEVFDTKVGGLRALLEATRKDDLKIIAFFSSVTGRYGRTGQVDYAMANEVLNKTARKLAVDRPSCRVVAINWGPWDGGMVNESLKKMFLAEGIQVIPLAAGARQLVHEISLAPGSDIEVVIGGHPHEAGNDPGKGGNAPGSKTFSTAFERKLNVDQEAFLRSHVINGAPVLPVAIIFEWLGHGALHENPGFVLHGFNDLRVLKGVVLEKGATYPIRVVSTKVAGHTGNQVVTVELRGGKKDHEIIHARAEAVLTTTLPESMAGKLKIDNLQKYPRSVEDAYQEVLFHGEDFRAIDRIEGCSKQGIVAQTISSPAPKKWMKDPVRSSWVVDPLVIDASLQLMILWTHQQCGELSLPSFISSFRQFQPGFANQAISTVIKVEKVEGKVAHANIEFINENGKAVGVIKGYESTMMPSLVDAFRRRSLEMEHQS